ncbi:MAG TPA: peptidoglycan DD-metalloendopeptidase family protein [Solirubrobacterales bacterium]|nr:peptidoglycan DD-metalloendopeptidase family protein [Solirubrobacterales bacterium]
MPEDRSKSVRFALAACAAALTLVGAPALAQDLESQKSAKQAELESVREKGEVLSTEIAGYSKQIDQLAGEVAVLRNREAIVAEELAETEAQLDTEKAHLDALREKLGRSLKILSKRLVEIYKSDQPDALTVILDSDGFDDLVSRYDYLNRIQDQDAGIVDRVRGLRNETEDLVGEIRNARDEIAAKKAELERTRMQLEAREAELDAVRDDKAAALDATQEREHELEGDISDLSAQIQEQLQQQSSTTSSDPLPAGPIQGASGGFIWPVNGPVSSPFGPRWGRLHAGIDISAPSGTPIRAVKDGNVVLAAPTSGYGNYTCIDHGGGLSSCYAHQSSYAITSGSVSQGDVIGYVGCTGSCFGDHLHFEIRVNGVPTDPLGYL